LSRLLQRHLATGSHNADALTLHDHGYHAAVRLGDVTGQATALLDIGFTYGRLGDHGRAAASLQRAAQLFRSTGSPTGQRRAPDVPGDPTDRSAQALTLFQQMDDRLGEAYAREGLGLVHLESGRTGSAAGHLRRALTLFRQTGDPAGETWTLEGLGLLHARLGNDRRATGHQEQALAVCRATGDRIGEARVLNSLGETARSFGRPADSLSHHAAARAVAADTGDRPQEARALTGLGHAHRALGDSILAREHYRQALSLYTGLGRPEAYQIRAHLSALLGDRR
jgi:tetratricopeptide (TPR) repeat protein